VDKLSLSDNEINVVDLKAFCDIRKLRYIDLSYNNLQFINASMFSDNPVLETVSCKRNPLAYAADFSPNIASHSVKFLDLSSCSLNSLNSQSLSQLPGFQILDLSSNNLQEFHQDILNPLTELIFINLSNNRWKCDCDIVEVLDCLSERRKSQGLDGERKPVKYFDALV
jgi:Leucine-rich repeat (LRR) protein